VTLERYLLRQLVVGMTFAVAGMAFVAIPGILVQAFHKLSGVGMAAILGFLPLVLVDLIPYLLPIGFLLALVATYGRMAADNEWTAILMAGVHPLRMLAPAAALSLVLSGALYFLATEVSPQTKFRQRDYTKSSVVRLLRSLSPGRTELKFGEFYLSSQRRDPLDRNRFEQVCVHVPQRGEEPARLVYADSARFQTDGATMTIDLDWPRWVGPGADVRGATARFQLDLEQLFETDVARRHDWKYQTSRELQRRLARTEELIDREGREALATKTQADGFVMAKDMKNVRYELHARRALAAVCPMFLLLGAATGLILRRGSQLAAFAAAVLYALVYYLLSMRLGKGLVNSDVAPQWLAAWGATMAGTSIGAVLTWLTLRR
jgi:lipopolysaccharide export LptBFGC system permease protein LptF